MLEYRREIDGLRALAVLAVVIYHANFSFRGEPLLSGGFLGVDIFFVISGYLITSIILRELDTSKFSIINFYHRRARRILPALFLVLLTCLPFAWRLMTPIQLKAFSGSAESVLLFSSNFWFWTEDSYWAGPSELKPLLHTWTLALEEQFYILFPLFLILMWRRGRDRILPIFLILFLASLLLSQAGSTAFKDANFFLLPTRAWELLAGAILAKIELSGGRKPAGLPAQLLPLIGVLLIACSLVIFTGEAPHPSFLTVVPVLGTCLIIWFARPGERVTDILSNSFLVGIGLISYSLYLWHYPVFAFWRIWSSESEVPNLTAAGLISVSVLLSVLSYFLIERPARSRTVVPFATFAPAVFATFFILISIGAASYATNGFANRYGDLAALFTESGSTAMAAPTPNPIQKGTNGTILLVGDSHAGVLTRAASELAKKYGYAFQKRAFGSCPVVDVKSVVFDGCDEYRKKSAEIVSKAPPSIIIYAVHWRKYQDRSGQGKYRGTVTPYEGESLREAYRRTFQSWIDEGHRLVLIDPGMETERNIQKQLKELLDPIPKPDRDQFMANLKLEVGYDKQVERAAPERDMIDSLAKKDHILAVDPLRIFCSSSHKSCAANDGKTLFISDFTHYSRAGAQEIMRAVERKLLDADWIAPSFKREAVRQSSISPRRTPGSPLLYEFSEARSG